MPVADPPQSEKPWLRIERSSWMMDDESLPLMPEAREPPTSQLRVVRSDCIDDAVATLHTLAWLLVLVEMGLRLHELMEVLARSLARS